MSSRREFLSYSAAASLATAMSFPPARAIAGKVGSTPQETIAKGPRIRSALRREETVRRYGGVGDNWHMSWAADDRQYVSLCDGFGFTGQSKYLYNARMFALEGRSQDARFHDLPGYPQLAYYPSQKLADPRYYPFGTLALDGQLYQFMSTFNRRLLPGDFPGAGEATQESRELARRNPLRFNGVKLIYSPDQGRTWCNQGGSTPVVWEDWEHRSRETMLFFEETQEAFSLTSVLQMGKNYEFNRDGYVYVYAPNGNSDGRMNELVMFRVPKAQILYRATYEYFAGLQANGSPKWDRNIDARRPVCSFPRGWVNTMLHPYAWHPSLAYNAPLGLYMMANWGMGTAPNGDWFAKPSYLGFWVAREPWGPWTQIHEETAWAPAGQPTARAYQPQIAPKWIAADGRSFWLVWTDLQMKGDEAEFERLSVPLNKKSFDQYTIADWALKNKLFRKFVPYYSFNTQRVDLSLA